MREQDRATYNQLLQRGHTADSFMSEGREEYAEVEKQVRERLVDRLYPRVLLARVMKIAAAADYGGS